MTETTVQVIVFFTLVAAVAALIWLFFDLRSDAVNDLIAEEADRQSRENADTFARDWLLRDEDQMEAAQARRIEDRVRSLRGEGS